MSVIFLKNKNHVRQHALAAPDADHAVGMSLN